MNNTFIIVTWNNAIEIKNLIESIIRYEPDSRIIIVDNNSSDNTIQIIKNLNLKSAKIIGLNKNIGFAKANNIAIKFVETEYITFINPDTELNKSVIKNLIDDFKRNKSIGLISIKLKNKNDSVQKSIFKFQDPFSIFLEQFGIGKILPEFLKYKFSPENSRHLKRMYVDWVLGAFMFTSLKLYKRIGGFSEDYFLYSEDMDICYKYHLKKLKILFDPSMVVLHIGGASENKSKTDRNLKLLKSFCIFAKKYNLNKNIKSLYICYKFKYILSYILPILMNKRTKYLQNLEFLREEIK